MQMHFHSQEPLFPQMKGIPTKKGFNSPWKCGKHFKAKSLHMLKAQMMFHVKHYFYLYCFEYVGS